MGSCSTCIHEEDQRNCKMTGMYPCDLVIIRVGDVPKAVACDSRNCFDVISSPQLHDQTKNCLASITMANLSNCRDCFTEKKASPLSHIKMQSQLSTSLDLSHNKIDSILQQDFFQYYCKI